MTNYTIANNEQFKAAIKEAAKINNSIKQSTKELSKYKPNIIDYMKTNNITSEEIDGFKATYSVATSRSMDQDKVIEILEKRAKRYRKQETKELILSAIEYKPTINSEVIEDLLFKGFLTAEDLAEALTETTSDRIRLDAPK